MTFIRFMGSGAGRLARVVAGLVLVGLGAWLGGGWWVLSAVGLVPLSAGVFNVCLVAPLLHAPVRPVSRGT